MEKIQSGREINAYISDLKFRSQLFGARRADVRVCLEEVSAMYEELSDSTRKERDAAHAQLQEQVRELLAENERLTQNMVEKEQQNAALTEERTLSAAALARGEEKRLVWDKKITELEMQRKIYAEKAEDLVLLLTEQKKATKAAQDEARREASGIVARAKREADAIVNTAQEKVRRHTEKEEQAMQSITDKGRELQGLLRGLREQVGALAKEIDELQARAGELKMLRALREQVEELAQELDSMQQRSESATDREGYAPPLPQAPTGERAEEKKEDKPAAIQAERPVYDATRQTRMQEIERQRASLQALREQQEQDEQRLLELHAEQQETDHNARAAELSAQLAQATELLRKHLN
ncbi:MAG: hypothetical protein FWF10_00135 [Clostridiales bacterium]|nr:hypothetical protein [Clostridiales bacterium]